MPHDKAIAVPYRLQARHINPNSLNSKRLRGWSPARRGIGV
jgi:hypothetical protein